MNGAAGRTRTRMQNFKAGDVVKVPFPYVERPVKQYRPALVVSSSELQEALGLLWVLMITSAKNKPWAGDVEVAHLEEAGLPAPSVIRCAKIATIEAAAATRIGALQHAQMKLVSNIMQRALGSRS
jgi:mRNA interferase MazF